MNKNEIKKALYKQKPTAVLSMIRQGVAYYSTKVIAEDSTSLETVNFEVPVNDMGEADFFIEMDGKYLGRWIVE
jgi:hypothetical protein